MYCNCGCVLIVSAIGLHSQIWARECKAGTTSTKQGESFGQDGGRWISRKACGGQGNGIHVERQNRSFMALIHL